MDLLEALRANTRRFVDVLRDADADAPVPTCPGWTGQDLAWHLAEGQSFWADIVANRHTEPRDDPVDRPPSFAGCLDLVEKACMQLHTALAETADDVPVWSWDARGNMVGWVRRRQAHEALVHRLDAEATLGSATAVPRELAVDGIDELLSVYVEGLPEWGTFTSSGHRVQIGTDGSPRTWRLALGRMTGTSPATGRSYDLAAAITDVDGPADLTVTGPAAAVHAWLWGRGPVEPLRLSGDLARATDLRDLVADATQ